MPRLNYGTLLENIVVLEATRTCFKHLDQNEGLAFATSFAMPPLSQCWVSTQTDERSPAFSYSGLQTQAQQPADPSTLQGLWTLCLKNLPGIPICPYFSEKSHTAYDGGGPNAPLLAAMLSARLGRRIDFWVNDDGGRYGDRTDDGPTSVSEGLKLLEHAGALVEASSLGSIRSKIGRFPDTIDDLQIWLKSQEAVARIGFLDPDTYMEGGTTVSSDDHKRWLEVLGAGCDRALAIMFFGTQNRGLKNVELKRRIRCFHDDQSRLYSKSLVFRRGNFATGIKVLWPAESIEKVVTELGEAVSASWNDWSRSFPTEGTRPGPLYIDFDGSFSE